ncbi:hypothetical protein PUNSTDRAFT_113285 [Punctularia strigosozonata HHB-11173 SS5]|uniref:uncharacterized protein n=1 Tax=Punctularia strigosozonata (strain HHB-11173) TaxID=741275 RepID=UPI0004417DD4|nr:uncharacterized protein PUNSTDRAFT_113285 [Punctularia strigosozonata HHB-11173 SS5]EIN09996.1 hypothetical protein PUNSTDRAFT_113285 [Punctularia strigosozonata HHB-11173 SS5]
MWTGIFPTFVCYFILAGLVLVQNTRLVRLALGPIACGLTYHAATSYDLAKVKGPGFEYWNFGLVVIMIALAMRMFEWSLQREPLRKTSGQANHIVLDALDLAFNTRGLGWTWSRGLHVPRPIKASTPRFLLRTVLHAACYFITFDTLHYFVQSFGTATFGSPAGGTIFDASLPPLRRYLRSTFLTVTSGTVIYAALVLAYDLIILISFSICSVSGIIGLSGYQDPEDWPPLFHKPYLATSLADFWGKRWHQAFRRSFIVIGAEPLRSLALAVTGSRNVARAAGVLGAFLISGVLHDWGMWGMGRGTDPWRVIGFFVLSGVGMILENAWERHILDDGKWGKKRRLRVDGLGGWIWTIGWTILWGHMLVEAWLVRGLPGSVLIPEEHRPGRMIVEYFRSNLANLHLR